MRKQRTRIIIQLPSDHSENHTRKSLIKLLKDNDVRIISAAPYMPFIVSEPIPEKIHRKIKDEMNLIIMNDIPLVAEDAI